MAALLDEIAWEGEPLVPARADPAWEAEIKRRGGQVSEVDRRIGCSPWLREALLSLTVYRPVAMPLRLFHIGAMVTAQENACRYCYGANRAYMKILGYPEDFIHRIERDLHMAELDAKEQAFIAFCRSLARSRPRPARSTVDRLVALGFSRPAVCEMAFAIALGCGYNRVSTFLACPPERGFERLANGPIGRIIGLAAPLLQRLKRPGAAPAADAPLDVATLERSRFSGVLVPLAGLPAARNMRDALDGVFASTVLGPATKALMFAVVARTLECGLCETQARSLLAGSKLSGADADAALDNLHSDLLPRGEVVLLSWSRSTVHYDTAAIQRETRELRASLGEDQLVEAIGVAALANATVRLAMLHA